MSTLRIIIGLLLIVLPPLQAGERVPWTDSRLSGSPNPPKPYANELIWPEITFQRACDIAHLPSRESLLITEQKGKIWILPDQIDTAAPDKKLFADFAISHDPFDSVFSLAFHPEFETNREVFVFYRTSAKALDDGTRISRFTVFADRFELDPESEEILLTFRSGGHNGGHLGFGHDGMLYILAGDSEVPSPPDPLKTGQDISDLLSSVLRIDVDRRDPGKTYAIPGENPFLKVEGARPEIWAYGLRNPWKLCFHPETGDLWVGDVGWELWEMLYRVERGANYGWSIVEGVQPILTNQNPGPSPISPATVLHPHTEFASITGGYVYEGDRLPDLKGRYLYGDFVTGQLWGLRLDGSDVKEKDFLADTRMQIVSFGQAAKGEVIFLDWPTDQHLYRLVPNPADDRSGDFPKTLSQTGIFSDIKKEKPSPGVYPFSIQGEMWHDGATAKRWVGVPGSDTMGANRSPFAIVPEDTILAKTLERGGRKLETQVLHYSQKQWQGYSYRWNEEQTDAELVPTEGETVKIEGESWTFHSRTDCVRCHNVGSDFRLAFHPGQLNREGQLDRFLELGIIDEAFAEKAVEQPTAETMDPDAPIDIRARTWLAANCAHCHRNRGGGSVALHMNLEAKLESSGLFEATPEKGNFGIPEAKLLTPGDPYRSVLYYRSVTPGIGHMPMIGARSIDPTGEKLLHDWIASLGDVAPPKPGIDSLPSALRLAHLLRSGEIGGDQASEWIEKGISSPNPMISGLFQDFL